MIKMTKIQLELMSDIDMYLFIEKEMRGGKANNKYIQPNDIKKPSEFVMYLDANNLYGTAMS